MNRLIKESLEQLLQDTYDTRRLGRRIINLAGFLGPNEIPEHIKEQLARLSGLLVQQEAFDALLQPVMTIARSQHLKGIDSEALTGVLAELGEARRALQLQEQINYSELTAWLVGVAEGKKIIRITRDAR